MQTAPRPARTLIDPADLALPPTRSIDITDRVAALLMPARASSGEHRFANVTVLRPRVAASPAPLLVAAGSR